MTDFIQTIILTLADGRKAVYTGPKQMEPGDSIREITATEGRPLPEGCSWGKMEKEEPTP
jgi:hypothetical protein